MIRWKEKEKKNLERKHVENEYIEIDKYASRYVCVSENEDDFYFSLYSFACLLVFGVCIVSAFDIHIFGIFPFEIFLPFFIHLADAKIWGCGKRPKGKISKGKMSKVEAVQNMWVLQ